MKERVPDEAIIDLVRVNPGITPRQVAEVFWTPTSQLTAGKRLKKLAREGRLVDEFFDGWRYWTPEGRDRHVGRL